MKGTTGTFLGLAFLFAILSQATSDSTRVFSVPLLGDANLAARRQALIDFAATHDWNAEFTAAGIDLPVGVEPQLLGPLRDRTPNASAPSHILYEIHIEQKWVGAFVPRFERIEAACNFIEARLALEARFAEIRSATDPDVRRRRLWAAYGSGFDPLVLEFLRAYETEDENVVIRAFVRDLIAGLEERGVTP